MKRRKRSRDSTMMIIIIIIKVRDIVTNETLKNKMDTSHPAFGPAQTIFFRERYFSMGIALRSKIKYRSVSYTDAVSMLDKRWKNEIYSSIKLL